MSIEDQEHVVLTEEAPPNSTRSQKEIEELHGQILLLKPLMRNFISKKLRKGEENDLDDLVQQTLIKATRNLDQFNPNRGSLRSWLIAIANNATISYFRSIHAHARDQRLEMPIDGIELIRSSEGLNPEEAFLGSEKLRITMDAIRALPPRDQGIMKLYLEEFSIKDIASKLSIPEGSVKSIISRSRAKLKRIFEDKKL